MLTVLSKFDKNDELINNFLRNPKYSIQIKSWHMFKRLGIKDWVARQEILQLNSIGHRILYEINEVDENSRYVSK